MCIRRALADGKTAAFVAGLGAAVADTFYGAVAGLGLSLISDFLLNYRAPLSIIGAAFLLVLGWRAWKAPPLALAAGAGALHLGLVKDFTVTLSITLTNPATILAFMAVFASIGAIQIHDAPLHSALMITGVFLGSALWWLTLSALASAVRHRFTERWLGHLNQASGGLLMASGVLILATTLWDLSQG